MSAKDAIAKATKAIWYERPAEIGAILKRRDINHPMGNLLFAEGTAREFCELMWSYHEALANGSMSVETAHEILPVFYAHLENELSGMYFLREGGSLVHQILEELPDSSKDEMLEVMEELKVFLTRLDVWLDMNLPWEKINQQIRDGLVP